MSYRLQRMMALIVMIGMLGMILAACGGDNNTGGTTGASSAPSAATGGGASAEASPMAGGDASAEASPMAGGDASAEASPMAGGDASAEASPMAGGDTEATAEATGQAAGGQTVAAACPDTAQGQQVTMWSPLTGGDGGVMTQLAQQYSQENEHGITVQHVPQPEYAQRLNTAVAGNTLPTMIVVRAADVAEFAERNIIVPMGEEAVSIVGGADLGADFPEDVWNIGEYEGERYAIPLDVHPLVLYYNTEMFEQAGIEMPTDRPMTREEFEAAADALNQNGVMGIAIGTLFSGETLFDTLIHQFGGRTVNEEGTEATYNSPEGVEALTYLRDLKQKYSPDISGQGDPEVTAFSQGRAAMVIHGPWHISNLSQLPFTGFAMVPQFGDQYAVQGGSHQLAMSTEDPAQQAAAACWIGWLSENSAQWATAGQVPARQSVRTNLESIAPPVAAFAESADAVILLPSIPGIGGAIGGAEGFGRAVNPVLLGEQQDIQAALDQAAQRSNQLLEQNAQQYGGQ